MGQSIIKIAEVKINDIIVIDNCLNRVDQIEKIAPKTIRLFTTLLLKESTISNYKDKSFIINRQPHVRFLGGLIHKKRMYSTIIKYDEVNVV